MNRIESSLLPCLSGLIVLVALFSGSSLSADLVAPFESSREFQINNDIDRLVLDDLKEKGIQPAHLCSDEVFVRRVHLDVIGTLPEPWVARQFVESKDPDKRAILIDKLLQDDTYADYWTLKWCDVLRVKAEFPINLWPNAVQAYHRWIYEAIKENMPYDRFARELLSSSGSNFRVAPVNFYRAIQGQEPSSIARAVGLTFMGTRLENWPQDRQKNMEAFFSRVAYKGTAEWKEEIVYLDPAQTSPLNTFFPEGTPVKIAGDDDPRVVFADWLITPENPWFGRSIVNRLWFWMFGRGIIHEPDDIRPDNPPVNPELLAWLEKELVQSNYNLKHLLRVILNSRTYQQSSISQADQTAAEMNFACYPVRRLDAEVLVDALNWLSGSRERYSSAIPEPFTFVPEENRTIELADGSITSQFLEMFGRPSRDTGLLTERNNDPSRAQSLHLLNSSNVQQKIERSWRLRRLPRQAKWKTDAWVKLIYLNILSRYPTSEELAFSEDYFKIKGINKNQAASDLAWALINSKEFLYRH